jgi:hypothetical protein
MSVIRKTIKSAQAQFNKLIKKAKNNSINKETKIELAIASSRLTLLPFNEFLNITNYKFNKYVVDKFYHSIKDDIPIYLDNDLIKWCGYAGELKKQKQSLISLIEKYDIPYIELNNDEYEDLRNIIIKSSTLKSTQDSKPLKLTNSENESDDSENESDNSENDDSENNESEGDDSENESDDDSDNESDDNSEEEIEEINTLYPAVDKSHGKGKTKHILIMPDDFRMIVMRLPTKVGAQVCRYYVELEKIVKMYLEYQNRFLCRREELLQIELKEARADRKRAEADRKKAEADRKRAEADRKKAEVDRKKIQQQYKRIEEELQESNQLINDLDDDINELNERLDVATNDRVPKVDRTHIREVFVMMKLNDDDETTHDYYVIRAQKCNLNKAINRIIGKFPNATKVITINCQPNSMNLYNRIKEQLSDYIDYDKNYISPIGISHPVFLKRVRRINNQKKTVDVDE